MTVFISRISTAAGVVVVSALGVVVGVSAPPAAAAQAKVCAPVQLTATGQDLGFDSNGIDHTTATVSVLGVKIGSTAAAFTPSGPPGETSLAFTGPIVYRPSIGQASLTAQVSGAVDLGTGAFSATSSFVSGSGGLATVSGHLTFRGLETLATGTFDETITGVLCAPLNSGLFVRS